MLQQIIALIIIAFFLARLLWQKQKKQIAVTEFIFWFLFWLLAASAIIFLKWLDKLVGSLGFSGSGIDTLLYLSIALLFYLIFKYLINITSVTKKQKIRHSG